MARSRSHARAALADLALVADMQEARAAAAQRDAGATAHAARAAERALLRSTHEELREAVVVVVVAARGSDDGAAELRRPDGTRVDAREVVACRDRVRGMRAEVEAAARRARELRGEVRRLEETAAGHRDALDRLDARAREEEERAGVVGHRDVREELQATGERTAANNAAKAQTLDEISAMVQEIARTLASKKERLEPKVCKFSSHSAIHSPASTSSAHVFAPNVV